MKKFKVARGSGLGARGNNQKRTAHSPEPTTQSRSADLLFEIGTEELPAAYLPGLAEQLALEARTLLEAGHFSFGSVETFGAPRRLVLFVRGLGAAQHKPAEEIRGPSKQAAYDAHGKPTPALLGFLRSRGGELKDVKVVTSDKGEHLYLVKPPTSVPTAQMLPALLPQLLARLRAPKTMRWDDGGVRFARPVRWLLARYGSMPIRCAFGKLTSGTMTRIGRPGTLSDVPVPSAGAYASLMKRHGIVLDHQARRAFIERAVGQIAKQADGVIAPEMIRYGLLDEVTHLVEQPVSLSGTFDPTYLELPRDVLLASMAKHQRVFAVEAHGALLPHWIAILEGKPGKPKVVQEVIERILNARLADSLLFWNQDRKRPLTQSLLSGVAFHEQLGSMEDKTRRLEQLSRALADMWQLAPEERKDLTQACLLAKADLVTTMVKEFPTLQGIMGKHYAAASGESQAVAEAIEEHYLPLADRKPKTLIGSALAILDKYDTLAGYFSVGIEPTGDQDPFGLRRAAQGIVETAWAVQRPLSLAALFAAWQPTAPFAAGATGAAARVHRYLLDRLYTFEWPAPAPSKEHIDAVLNSPCDDVLDVMERIAMLSRLGGKEALRKAAKIIERTGNILKGAWANGKAAVDPSLLQEPLEQRLWELHEQQKQEITQLIDRKQYAEATTQFGELFYEPLHAFFDQVMVNVPDEALRRNRLALMRAIHALYTDRVADLSKLTVVQQHEEHA